MDIKGVGENVVAGGMLEQSLSVARSNESVGGQDVQTKDTVSIGAQTSLPRSSFSSDDEYSAYHSVLAQGQTNPSHIVDAHCGLDPERVYRLLGLID